MPQLEFDISAALAADTQSAFDTAIKALEAPLAEWRKVPLPHFTLPEKTDDLPDLRDMAADMAVAFARVLFWEPAGQPWRTSAGANSRLGNTARSVQGPQLVFADNLDATSMAHFWCRKNCRIPGFLSCRNRGERRKP